MRGRKLVRVLKFVAIGIVAFTVFGFVVTHLWNYLMPGLFGLHMITFRQAIGLMLLGRLLFGGFRPGGFRRGGGGIRWREELMQRYVNMTPEEREKFIAGMSGRCGTPRTPAPQPNQ
ncbi:MAG TPA: hypothetical protein VGI34_06985 [Candidatus Acidoferrales bacterium]|jgi:hypothetical protein